MYYEAEEDQEKQDKEQPTKVPIEFSDEEAGPPNVDPAFLQRLDDEATEKKIRRLTKMDVISLVSTDPQEATGSVPCANSAQEVYKWLTTKLVKEWRFREAAGFEAEATEEQRRRARLVAQQAQELRSWSPWPWPTLERCLFTGSTENTLFVRVDRVSRCYGRMAHAQG